MEAGESAGHSTVTSASAHDPGASQIQRENIRYNVTQGSETATKNLSDTGSPTSEQLTQSNQALGRIYHAVACTGKYNFAEARVPVPSALHIEQWRIWLANYPDGKLVDYLAFGWPVNFDRRSHLVATNHNHPSADQFPADVEYYIATEQRHGALAGPFGSPPVEWLHTSPLMTRPKKDAKFRRVIVDLSWPSGAAVNEGIDSHFYIDGPANIVLPTADYMADRLLQLGPGAYIYKTDLARGYRQLRVDPIDWPLLGFCHKGQYFVDICPPFGLRSSAMCMQRTSEAISYIHAQQGYHSKPYLDDFGGAEASLDVANRALDTLQRIMVALGVVEAKQKIHRPAQAMIWLGIYYDTVEVSMTIPAAKLEEIMVELGDWKGRTRATRGQMQRLVGLLQFVASVAPPVRIFSNRILQCLRDMPHRGSDGLSLGFKKDLKFFQDLLPSITGVRIIDKTELPYQEEVELDACLTGCGATIGAQFYAEAFPDEVLAAEHIISHLELLNIVVALKVWGREWRGRRVKIYCDNSNACLAMQTGRSRDEFIQHCIREIFLLMARYDAELVAEHRPGEQLTRADALSRMHASEAHHRWVQADAALRAAERVRVPSHTFELTSEL